MIYQFLDDFLLRRLFVSERRCLKFFKCSAIVNVLLEKNIFERTKDFLLRCAQKYARTVIDFNVNFGQLFVVQWFFLICFYPCLKLFCYQNLNELRGFNFVLSD